MIPFFPDKPLFSLNKQSDPDAIQAYISSLPPVQSDPIGFGVSGFNRGLGSLLGFPVDAVAGVINALPALGSIGFNKNATTPARPALIERPFMGSEWWREGPLKPFIRSDKPDTRAERVAERIGQEIGFDSVPTLATIALAPEAALPIAIANLGADVGSGLAGAAAREYAPDNDLLDALASLAGGVAGGGLAYGAYRGAGALDNATGGRISAMMADESGAVGSINARTADLSALGEAKMMASNGATQDDIFNKTGWWQGPDGAWKFEIPDNNARFRDWPLQEVNGVGTTAGRYDDLFHNPDVLEAYPDIGDIDTQVHALPYGSAEGVRGGFGITDPDNINEAYTSTNPEGSRFFSDGTPRMMVASEGPDEALDTLVHETQHAINNYEGMATGGSAEVYMNGERARRANPDLARWNSDPERVAKITAIRDNPEFDVEVNDFARYTREVVRPDITRRSMELSDMVEQGLLSEDEAAKRFAEIQAQWAEQMDVMFPLHKELTDLTADGFPLIKPDPLIDPYRAYLEGAGETEARTVTARRLLTPEQRAETPFYMAQAAEVPPEINAANVDYENPQNVLPLERLNPNNPLAPSWGEFNMTHEAIPYVDSGHLPGATKAPLDERLAYATDPRSSWVEPESSGYGMRDRDLLYDGATGRTRPMQGLYTPASGVTEYNPGAVATPFAPADSVKLGEDSRNYLEGVEAVRGYIDVQGGAAGHRIESLPTEDGANAYWLQRTAQRPATVDELIYAQQTGAPYGYTDAVDIGKGATLTSFDFDNPPQTPSPEITKALNDAYLQRPDTLHVVPARMETIYVDFEEAWKAGEGSGAATKALLERLDKLNDAQRLALDSNPNIAQAALDRLARDEEWAAKWGGTRADIQNARRIIGEGPGFIGRLKEALKTGAILPAVAAGIFKALGETDDTANGGMDGT